MLGVLFNSIILGRRQISWSYLNFDLKFDMEEECKGKKGKILFGRVLKKVTKRVEEDKALTKVIGTQKDHSQPNIDNIFTTLETCANIGEGCTCLVQW